MDLSIVRISITRTAWLRFAAFLFVLQAGAFGAILGHSIYGVVHADVFTAVTALRLLFCAIAAFFGIVLSLACAYGLYEIS